MVDNELQQSINKMFLKAAVNGDLTKEELYWPNGLVVNQVTLANDIYFFIKERESKLVREARIDEVESLHKNIPAFDYVFYERLDQLNQQRSEEDE